MVRCEDLDDHVSGKFQPTKANQTIEIRCGRFTGRHQYTGNDSSGHIVAVIHLDPTSGFRLQHPTVSSVSTQFAAVVFCPVRILSAKDDKDSQLFIVVRVPLNNNIDSESKEERPMNDRARCRRVASVHVIQHENVGITPPMHHHNTLQSLPLSAIADVVCVFLRHLQTSTSTLFRRSPGLTWICGICGYHVDLF